MLPESSLRILDRVARPLVFLGPFESGENRCRLIRFLYLCATVGLGEHYFVDLVVAVLFSVFLVALANFLAGRERHPLYFPFLTGLSMTGLWFLALRRAARAFWVSPVVPWLCCGVTLAVCFIAARKLATPQCEPEFKPFAPMPHTRDEDQAGLRQI